MVAELAAHQSDAYELERDVRCRQGAVIAGWIAIALLAGFGFVDAILFPDQLALLLEVRAACIAVVALFLGFLRSRFARRHGKMAGLALSVLLGIMVDALVVLTGGSTSPYYEGLSLIFMGMVILLPWRPAWSLLNSALIIATYVIAVVGFSPGGRFVPVNALAFLSAMTIVAFVTSAIAERLRRREFDNRTRLAEALRHKDVFLASVSHDLRTPLNVIVGYAHLLREEEFGPLTAQQTDAIDRILRSTGNQLALITDLFDLARIEQGKLRCEKRAVAAADLAPVLREAMDALLRDRPIGFEVHMPRDVIAFADPERLRQLLMNLLTNAAKFTDAGSIRITAARDDRTVTISVIDTGRGMDPALVQRATEPFVRGDGEGAGWGLGLAIVARLARLLDGGIVIESAPGRGTTVRLRLPAADERHAPSDSEVEHGMSSRAVAAAASR